MMVRMRLATDQDKGLKNSIFFIFLIFFIINWRVSSNQVIYNRRYVHVQL